jgi:peptidoglycan/LPS O-acetylase OafA/YrhL
VRINVPEPGQIERSAGAVASSGALASSGAAPEPVAFPLVASPPGAVPSPLPVPANDKPAGAGRLYVLDLLRFVAATGVLMFHFIANDANVWAANTAELFSYPVQLVAKYGWLGVECFFVISGFVICMSSWGRSLSAFVTSRVTRLMPAYVVAVVLASAALWLAPFDGQRPAPTHILYDLTLLQDFLKVPNVDVVYWTLLVELNFYLFFSIVVHFGLTFRRVLLFCMVWTTLALVTIHLDAWSTMSLLQTYWVPYFVAGITLYLIYRFGPNMLLWGVLAGSYILSLFCLHIRVESFKDPIIRFPVAAAITFVFFAIMTAAALRKLDWIRWRGLTLLGALTYPLYLLHAALGRVAINQLRGSMPPVLLLCLVVAGVLLLSYLVHRFVERPASSFVRRGLRASFDKIRVADRAEQPAPALPGRQ